MLFLDGDPRAGISIPDRSAMSHSGGYGVVPKSVSAPTPDAGKLPVRVRQKGRPTGALAYIDQSRSRCIGDHDDLLVPIYFNGKVRNVF